MSDPYRALVDAFPAEVEVKRLDGSVEFRIAGSLPAVRTERERIKRLCAGRAWLRLLGPHRWGEEWVIHGVLRERGRLIPADALHAGKSSPAPNVVARKAIR